MLGERYATSCADAGVETFDAVAAAFAAVDAVDARAAAAATPAASSSRVSPAAAGVSPARRGSSHRPPLSPGALMRSATSFTDDSAAPQTSGDKAFVLRNVSLGSRGIAALAATLATADVTSVTVANCYLGSDGCIELVPALRQNARLRHVDLSGNAVRDASVVSDLVAGLSQSLESLNLSWNKLGAHPSAFNALCDRLMHVQTLREVYFSNNLLGKECAPGLSRLISDAPVLRVLTVEWNALGAAQAPMLLSALQHTNSVAVLEAAGNGFSRQDADAINHRLHTNERTAAADVEAKRHESHLMQRIHDLEQELRDTQDSARARELEVVSLARDQESAVARADDADARMRAAQEHLATTNARHQEEVDEALASARKARADATKSAEDSSKRVAEACRELDEVRLEAQRAATQHAQERASLSQRLTDALETTAKLEASTAAAKATLATAEDDRTRLVADVKARQERIAALEGTVAAHAAAAARTVTEMQTTVQDCELLRSKLATAEAKAAALQAKLEETEGSVTTLQRQLDEHQQRANRQHDATRDDFVQQLHRHERRIAELQAAQARDRDDANAEIDRLKKKLEEAVADADRDATASSSRIAALEAEARKLHNDLAVARAELQRAEHAKASAVAKATALQEEFAQSLEEHRGQLSRAVDDVLARSKGESNESKQRIASLESQLKQAIERGKKYEARCKRTERDLEKRVLAGVHAAMAAGPAAGDSD